MLQQLKDFVYKRSLNKQLASRGRPRTRRGSNLEKARSVGIYFDATNVDERKTVLAFAQTLRDQGKQVQLLGYFQQPVTENEFSFSAFSIKEVDWAGRPKGPQVNSFLADPADLFLALTPRTNRTLEYIACLYPAALRVGPVSEQPQAFDLMLDLPARTATSQLIEQIKRILKVTNVRNEPATA